MANAVKLKASFNMVLLIEDMSFAKKNYPWVPVFEQGIGNAWKGIALRSHDGDFNTMSYQDKPHQNTSLMDVLQNVKGALDFFKCDMKRVRFLSLVPGAILGEHRDVEEGEWTPDARLHIPMMTNDDAVFYIDGQRLHMKVGELWYVDVSRPHSVRNLGGEERIHLVIDCVKNEWLDNLIATGQPAEFSNPSPK